MMRRIAGGVWVPVNNGDEEEISAKDGADIISTIDVNFQDIAQSALKISSSSARQIIWLRSADGGCHR